MPQNTKAKKHFFPFIGAMLLAAFLAGCITESVNPAHSLRDQLALYGDNQALSFAPTGPRYNLDPPLQDVLDPFLLPEEVEEFDPLKKYSAQTYMGDDGMITRHYYMPAGRGLSMAKLLVGHVTDLAFFGDPNGMDIGTAFNTAKMTENQVLVFNSPVITDRRESAGVNGMSGFAAYGVATGNVSDLLLVTTKSEEKLMEVDSFFTSMLTELPLIEIKVKVIEIAMSDVFQWGLENVITRLTTSDKSFLKEWFNFYNTQAMINARNNAGDFQGSLFNAWGVHDKFELDAAFELLQRVTDANILSAPTLAVLDGHRAIIETGDQVPKQSIVSTAVSAFYTYGYEKTGITLVIVPYLLPGGVIEVNVNAEVKALTGRETFDTPVGTLSQPILSKRYASTRLQIKEGQAFALGGLMSDQEFEIVSKLPLLGDIPLLGLLFKSKYVEKGKSQIVFYIEPRVITREDGWRREKKK